MERLFMYQATPNGYMIFYRGKSIGGAGVKLPRERPLRGNQALNNIREFSQNARDEIAKLEAGGGQARFRDAMAKIDADAEPKI